MLITVYSLPAANCVKCRAVEISMRNRGIESTKVLVNEDSVALAYIKSLGYSEAPVIVVTEGDEVLDHWSGFSDEKISSLKELVAA